MLSELSWHISSLNWGVKIDPFDLQARIGSTGIEMKQEVEKSNIGLTRRF